LGNDDDIRTALPHPPPPAPRRRDTAIAEAMARFDGTDSVSQDRAPPPRRTGSWWEKVRSPVAGPLVAAALIATISLPFAWMAYNPEAPAAGEQVSVTPAPDEAAPVRDVAQARPAAPATAPVESAPAPAPASAPASAAPIANRTEIAQASPAAPAMKAEEPEPLIVQGRVNRQQVQDTPVAVTVVSSERASADEGREVVVTGTRVSPRKSAKRGDWNACTINDPGQALSKCERMGRKATKDVEAQADAHMSDGLKQAWEGDLDGAIAAFDRAIAIAPNLSTAYLNRGLAYDRQGDEARAIADLDRAVQYAPRSAQAHYNRSVLLRKIGDNRRASADEARAVKLDPRYGAILE